MRASMVLSRQLCGIATAVLFTLSAACTSDASQPVPLAEETVAVNVRSESDERALAEQRRLANELGALEKRHAVLKQQMEQQKNEMARAELGLRELKQDLQRQKAETGRYIDQHEVQVACAYADQVAVDNTGEYSEKTKNCARVASMYCAVAMLSRTFRLKVAEVKQHVEEAEARARSLKRKISAQQKKLKTLRAELQATEDESNRTASEVTSLRQKLASADAHPAPVAE